MDFEVKASGVKMYFLQENKASLMFESNHVIIPPKQGDYLTLPLNL